MARGVVYARYASMMGPWRGGVFEVRAFLVWGLGLEGSAGAELPLGRALICGALVSAGRAVPEGGVVMPGCGAEAGAPFWGLNRCPVVEGLEYVGALIWVLELRRESMLRWWLLLPVVAATVAWLTVLLLLLPLPFLVPSLVPLACAPSVGVDASIVWMWCRWVGG